MIKDLISCVNAIGYQLYTQILNQENDLVPLRIVKR